MNYTMYMKSLSILFSYLIIQTNKSGITGRRLFQKNSNNYINTPPAKIQLERAEEITWDDGEVPWENALQQNDAHNNELYNFIHYKCAVIVYENTPLYDAIETDQTKIASISALVKTAYKEVFNADSFVSDLQRNFNMHIGAIPSDFLVISLFVGLAIIYNKTTETEEERFYRLYNFNMQRSYNEKYIKMRRLYVVSFIVFTCLMTKNVEQAE